jgi:small-conductance mechanosensitive channel
MGYSKAIRGSMILFLVLLLSVSPLISQFAEAAGGKAESNKAPGELEELTTYTPEQLRAALATLSDENARELLLAAIDQLAIDASSKTPVAAPKTGIAGIMQHLETVFTMTPPRLKAVTTGVTTLPKELGHVFDQMTGGKGAGHLFLFLIGIIAILLVSYGLEQLLKRTTFQFGEKLTIPLGGAARFGGAILAALPSLLGIMVFTLTSALLLLVVFGADGPIRHLYGPILTAIVVGRLAMLVMAIICAPKQKELRLLHMKDSSAQYLYSLVTKILWVLVVSLILFKWFQRIGIAQDSFLLVNISVGTFLMLWLAGLVWRNRSLVASCIRGDNETDVERSGWLTRQFAAIWHILALAYLFWAWFACASRVLLYGPHFGGALLRSLLVVPLFILLDRLMQAALPAILGTNGDAEDDSEPNTDSNGEPVPVRTLRSKLSFVRNFIRAIIGLVLLVWFLKAFNIELPFIEKIAGGGFNILVTIILALVGWRWLNVFITRKLAETAPDPADQKDEDDEFGGVVLDRSHTLLPMLRKFLGTVLFVMVIMIVLSSIGVDIGPLLAGAGVIGLAIGFGAQKLVSDVLSGFFFLMDDAFRVGEYIKAGSVSGTVEATTLRNAMIRHHLGTLQIVPYSDMGTITNSMRGGLVIKINIDLPYDTDIEVVRKVIKKVGKKMLTNPDYGDDFIQPVKSQGVSKVGDSVMTFRVKFTAKPGTQFVIKREAFRQIKDALEKKGIYLAHRKVIVEVPETPKESSADREQAIRAGAAAALGTMVNQKQEEEKSQKKT